MTAPQWQDKCSELARAKADVALLRKAIAPIVAAWTETDTGRTTASAEQMAALVDAYNASARTKADP